MHLGKFQKNKATISEKKLGLFFGQVFKAEFGYFKSVNL